MLNAINIFQNCGFYRIYFASVSHVHFLVMLLYVYWENMKLCYLFCFCVTVLFPGYVTVCVLRECGAVLAHLNLTFLSWSAWGKGTPSEWSGALFHIQLILVWQFFYHLLTCNLKMLPEKQNRYSHKGHWWPRYIFDTLINVFLLIYLPIPRESLFSSLNPTHFYWPLKSFWGEKIIKIWKDGKSGWQHSTIKYNLC